MLHAEVVSSRILAYVLTKVYTRGSPVKRQLLLAFDGGYYKTKQETHKTGKEVECLLYLMVIFYHRHSSSKHERLLVAYYMIVGVCSIWT